MRPPFISHPPFVGRCVRPHEAPFRVTRSPRRRRCDRRFHAWALGGLRLDADGAVAHWPGAIHSKYPLPGRLRRWRRRPGRVSGWGVLKDRTFLSDQWQVQVEEQEKSSDFLVQPTSQRSNHQFGHFLASSCFIMLHWPWTVGGLSFSRPENDPLRCMGLSTRCEVFTWAHAWAWATWIACQLWRRA